MSEVLDRLGSWGLRDVIEKNGNLFLDPRLYPMIGVEGRYLSSFSDNQLMRRVSLGDVTCLGILFERYQKPIYNYFLRLLYNGEHAEDLVQEVFYRILKYRHTYAEGVPFRMWIFRIAHNVGRDHFSRQKGTFSLEEEACTGALTSVTDPVGGLTRAEDLDRLQGAMDKLSPEKKEVLIMSRYHGMKYGEISAVTGVSVAAIKVRVHRALKDLRARYFAQDKEQAS